MGGVTPIRVLDDRHICNRGLASPTSEPRQTDCSLSRCSLTRHGGESACCATAGSAYASQNGLESVNRGDASNRSSNGRPCGPPVGEVLFGL